MFKKLVITLGMLIASSNAFAAAEDDPLLYKVMIDQLEVRNAEDNNPLVWDADLWIGKDLNKLWISTGGERVNGAVEEADIEFLYSRAIDTFWDFQIGWRHDLKPEPKRDWLALGIKGLAPYLFETDAKLYLDESGMVELKLTSEYEYMFSQKLVLSPEIEVALHNKDDELVGIGAGLSEVELGLRLRYELRREFAPYIGVNWMRKFGQTARYAENEGANTSETQFVVGIRAWF